MKKLTYQLIRIALLFSLVGSVLATDTTTTKAQLDAANQAAMTRYEKDKSLCNDETSSSARLQCRRDAKDEYDKSLLTAKTKMTATTQAPEVKPVTSCAECAKVITVSMTEKAGEGGTVGLVAGGLAGALLGRQVGGGTGRDLATIAGAAGGAYAGKQIEGKVKSQKIWTVSVQYASGNRGNFEFDHDPGLMVGDSVKNSGNTIIRN